MPPSNLQLIPGSQHSNKECLIWRPVEAGEAAVPSILYQEGQRSQSPFDPTALGTCVGIVLYNSCCGV